MYWLKERSYFLFPSIKSNHCHFLSMFAALLLMNLTRICVYRYPITTTLRFNLRAAVFLWLRSIIIVLTKTNSISSLLPLNSPWYLVPFLIIIELVRTRVRPITLCFRLLANIRAGHILLSLICKLSSITWLFGALFGIMELMVSMVQAFVFLILIRVYLDERASH